MNKLVSSTTEANELISLVRWNIAFGIIGSTSSAVIIENWKKNE